MIFNTQPPFSNLTFFLLTSCSPVVSRRLQKSPNPMTRQGTFRIDNTCWTDDDDKKKNRIINRHRHQEDRPEDKENEVEEGDETKSSRREAIWSVGRGGRSRRRRQGGSAVANSTRRYLEGQKSKSGEQQGMCVLVLCST